ncbi:MAG: hypothetical protein ABR572_06000 [Cryomorphaceae bacterium]|nr:hypothetical protein [Flavobacteriales bacterium]
MKTLKNYFLIALLGAAVIAGCRSDDDAQECPAPCDDPSNPECPNYDPCWDVQEPTAEIQMRETYFRQGQGLVWTPFDSVFYNNVEFSTPYVGPEFEHTWYLGSEVIYDAVFSREHPIPRPQFITVSHVLTYPVDSTCYPGSTGRDSTSATYYIIEHWNEFAIRSKFRGVFESQTDSFDFEFKRVYPDNSNVMIPTDEFANPLFVGINFHNEGDSSEVLLGGRNLVGHFTGNGNNSPSGTIQIDPADRKTTLLDYQYKNQNHVVRARILE